MSVSCRKLWSLRLLRGHSGADKLPCSAGVARPVIRGQTRIASQILADYYVGAFQCRDNLDEFV